MPVAQNFNNDEKRDDYGGYLKDRRRTGTKEAEARGAEEGCSEGTADRRSRREQAEAEEGGTRTGEAEVVTADIAPTLVAKAKTRRGWGTRFCGDLESGRGSCAGCAGIPFRLYGMLFYSRTNGPRAIICNRLYPNFQIPNSGASPWQANYSAASPSTS